MEKGLMYEMFIRRAFNNVERGADPAGLAEADLYNLINSGDKLYALNYLNKVKVGLSYAVSIYNKKYSDFEKINSNDIQTMEKFLNDILNATSGLEITGVLDEYMKYQEKWDEQCVD